jgi:hypothetical protein
MPAAPSRCIISPSDRPERFAISPTFAAVAVRSAPAGEVGRVGPASTPRPVPSRPVVGPAPPGAGAAVDDSGPLPARLPAYENARRGAFCTRYCAGMAVAHRWRRPSGAAPALSGPEQAKAASMPADDRVRCDDVQDGPRAASGPREPRPEHPVGRLNRRHGRRAQLTTAS